MKRAVKRFSSSRKKTTVTLCSFKQLIIRFNELVCGNFSSESISPFMMTHRARKLVDWVNFHKKRVWKNQFGWRFSTDNMTSRLEEEFNGTSSPHRATAWLRELNWMSFSNSSQLSIKKASKKEQRNKYYPVTVCAGRKLWIDNMHDSIKQQLHFVVYQVFDH